MFSNKNFYILLAFFSAVAIIVHIVFAGALAASGSFGFWVLDVLLWAGLGYFSYVAHKEIEDPNHDWARSTAYAFAIILIILAGVKGADYKAKKADGITMVSAVDSSRSK
jgi:membrane protein DedA with SNARE-associated domain